MAAKSMARATCSAEACTASGLMGEWQEPCTMTQVWPPSGGAGEGSSHVSIPSPGAASRALTVQSIANLHAIPAVSKLFSYSIISGHEHCLLQGICPSPAMHSLADLTIPDVNTMQTPNLLLFRSFLRMTTP